MSYQDTECGQGEGDWKGGLAAPPCRARARCNRAVHRRSSLYGFFRSLAEAEALARGRQVAGLEVDSDDQVALEAAQYVRGQDLEVGSWVLRLSGRAAERWQRSAQMTFV